MKRKTLISSILVIVLCLGLISGSTYALFTSESSVNMVVTSGKVDVSATITDIKVYSATADTNAQLITTDLAGEIQTGPFAGTYYYQGPLANNTFANGGTAAWATDTKVLTIDKITPGDKVTLNVDVQNNSNVAIQYRVRVNVLSGLKLYEGLVVKTDNISLSGVQKVGNWTYLPYDANTTALATIPVEIYLPLEAGDTYQDLSTSLRITVEAVQGNANVTNDSLTVPVQANVAVSDTNVDAVITDDSNLVTVTVPAAGIDSETTSLAVNVTPQDTVSNINITSTQESRSYDVEVLVTKSTSQQTTTYSDENNKVTIRMFIGTGLTGVKLYHVETEITQFNYDSTTGYIEFQTGSFSEYTVLYNKDIAVETINQQTQESTITIYTPTETPNVYEDGEGNVVQITVDENNELNIDDSYIAYIKSTTGTTFYKELGTAFLDLSDNETLVLMKDVESNRCYLYSDEGDATFDLNGFTLKVTGCDYTSGDEVYGYTNGGRAVKVTNGALCIKNGTIDGRNYVNGVPTANPSTVGPWSSTRLGGCVRINGGDVVLEDLTMYNNDGWGNSVKLESNNSLTMNNCTIISVYGACIEIGSGVANITNCDFVETNAPSPSYHAACIAVCDGGTINLLGKNTANGEYALFVYNSGGTINVADGSFAGSSAAIYVDAGDNVSDSRVNVSGGTYTGDMIVSAQSKGSYKAYLVITGGTFDHDPTAYVDKLHYAVIDNGNGTWTVQKIKTYVYSIVPNADNTKATVTYKSDDNANFIATEEVRYLTAKNLGTETTNTTFDIYCGDDLIRSGVTFSNVFNPPGVSANTDVLIERNVLVLPKGDIYFTGDSYVYSDAIFMIGSTDGSGNPTTRLLATGSGSVSYKGLQPHSREATLPQRTYYFENIVFDGSAQQNKWGHLITMTSYPIDAEFNNVVFQNMEQPSRTSVIGAWANQTLSDGSFPTKNDDVGIDIRFTNVKVNNINNKPIFQFQGFTKAEIDANPDCYSYISVVFDAVSAENCGLNNSSAYATQGGNNNYTYNGTHYYWTVNGVEVSNVEGTTVTLGTVTLGN